VDDDYFDQSPAPQASARPARSPGLRLSNGPRTPPITVTGSYATDGVSPIDENAPVGTGQTGGVKRTKSLMQKIKSMVRTRDGMDSVPQKKGARSYSTGQQPRLSPSGGRFVRDGQDALPGHLVVEQADDDIDDDPDQDPFATPDRIRDRSVSLGNGGRSGARDW
jgi:hypothetical protein